MKSSLPSPEKLRTALKDKTVHWQKAQDAGRIAAKDSTATVQAIDIAEELWGKSSRTKKFRELFEQRGLSLYDYRVEDHYTGSAIVLDPKTRSILMTFHPWYKLWLQLGGHDSVKHPLHNPVAISAQEAWEESGIDQLFICDVPIRIDPHSAKKCKAAKDATDNHHYDICYMLLAKTTDFKMSHESVDMAWVSIDELKKYVAKERAQQRALDMTESALALHDALTALHKLPVES